MKSKPYISIDIETTGLDPENCQILEIGMMADDWVTPVAELPTFHCFVKHNLYCGEAYALWLNRGIFDILKSHKPEHSEHRVLYPGEAVEWMAEWIAAQGHDLRRIQAGGKNFGTFDKVFLEKLPGFKLKMKFNHRFFDPGMLFWNPDIDETPPDSKKCMERSGQSGVVAHTALEDAISVVHMIRYAAKERLPKDASPYQNFLNATQDSERLEPRNGY